MARSTAIQLAKEFLTFANDSMTLQRLSGVNAADMKRLGYHSAWAMAMNRAIKNKRTALWCVDCAYHVLYGHPPQWRDALKVGDKIRTTRAGRTGRVVKTYPDGSAAIRWDDSREPLCGAHERMPRSLLCRISTPATKSAPPAQAARIPIEIPGCRISSLIRTRPALARRVRAPVHWLVTRRFYE